MTREPAENINDLIQELFWERSRACDYYESGEYEKHSNKSRALDKKLKKRLGKKRWRELFWYVYGIDAVKGEELAGLQGSCYKRGFNDALILMGEIERAKNGLPTIFN
ncbi:hypothetical protein [Desulfosporosinus lacus]|uniref:Uncharacterized protein n=1 Tax=Desulfosporosinus lacus DSM 15449 TaxID=1121420 RepID=A0A1M5WF49_9FIRM|nr:hypothetical protein [Desulfosporosinus lacus]SHH86135.1 hypothetical protein SAMN02746098_01590 [Desulfosporosinus lacus DSM 15449]